MTDMENKDFVTEQELMTPVPSAQEKRKQAFAVTSLVLGILSVLTLSGCLLFGIAAISFAIAARDGETKKINGKAKAGLILGIVSIVLFVLAAAALIGFYFLLISALQDCGDALGESISGSTGNGTFFLPPLLR